MISEDGSFESLKVYVISVFAFSDRRASICRQAEKFNLDVEFIYDFDAESLSVDDHRKFEGDLTVEAKSCVLKHMEAQRRLVESGCSVALIIEDDVILFEDFTERLGCILNLARALANKGWLISLGGADERLARDVISMPPNNIFPLPISTAEAYLINSSGARLRLEWMKSNKITRAADHHLKFIDKELGLRQYRVVCPLCTQGSVKGIFQSSLDKSRRKRSLMYLRARFFVRRIINQAIPRYMYKTIKNIKLLFDPRNNL